MRSPLMLPAGSILVIRVCNELAASINTVDGFSDAYGLLQQPREVLITHNAGALACLSIVHAPRLC